MFTSILGQGAKSNCVIATTMWSDIPEKVATVPEEVTKSTFWNGALVNGCK